MKIDRLSIVNSQNQNQMGQKVITNDDDDDVVEPQ